GWDKFAAICLYKVYVTIGYYFIILEERILNLYVEIAIQYYSLGIGSLGTIPVFGLGKASGGPEELFDAKSLEIRECFLQIGDKDVIDCLHI
ncbi:hypothetical protein ACJX0J_009543, partial [Zea mays]